MGGGLHQPPLHWRGLIHEKYFQTTNAVDTLPLSLMFVEIHTEKESVILFLY